MWYIPTTEYYSAVKRNELLIDSTTGMSLKIIMLSRRSQKKGVHRSTECLILFIEHSGKCSLVYNDTRQISGCLGMGVGNRREEI